MTDRELLMKLAAKAAGIEHPGGEHSIANDGRLWDCNGLRWWNPLTDDGDALRLAVKLHLNVMVGVARDENGALSISTAGDDLQSTRHAIVQAAATIGKALP